MEYVINRVCRHAIIVNMFKNKIDKYLVKVGYTVNKVRYT